MSTELVVVIPTAQRYDLLARTLESLVDARKPVTYRATLVIENGSRSGAEEVAERFQASLRLQYRFIEQPGKCVALNTAIEDLGDCLAIFFDDDVRVAPDALCAYAEAAAGAKEGRFFGGPVSIDHEQEPPAWLAPYLPRSVRGWERSDETEGVDFLGFNWAAFTSDLRAVGGFDTTRGPGAADGSTIGDEGFIRDRLIRHGVQGVYVPGARVWHYVPADRCTPGWLIDRNYRHGIEWSRRSDRDRARLLGIPPWVIRRWVTGLAKSVVAKLTQDPAIRFRDAHRRSYNRGLLRGARMHRKRPEGESTCPPSASSWNVPAAVQGQPSAEQPPTRSPPAQAPPDGPLTPHTRARAVARAPPRRPRREGSRPTPPCSCRRR